MSTIDVTAVIDRRRLSGLQLLVLILAGCTIVLDGIDIQAIAFAAPAIASEFSLDRASLGPVFSIGLVGMALGSLVMGPVADRYGRRVAVLLSVTTFGAFTFLTGFASSLNEVLAFRFFTGLGLGGTLPSLVVLVGEYAPRRMRALCAGAVLAGVPAGGLIGGLLATWAIPNFGWPSIFYIGGGLPLLMLPILWFKLPESISFMVRRGASDSVKVRDIMKKIDPDGAYGPDVEFAQTAGEAAASRSVPFGKLFRDGMARNTLLLWTAFFTNLMAIYFLFSWIPTLLVGTGYTIAEATTASIIFNFGGLFGLFGMGWIVNRLEGATKLVIALALLIGAIHVALVGALATHLSLLLVAVFIAGVCILGTQGQLFNLGTTLYPVDVRATGIGWAAAFGRDGSVIGPLLGGVLILLELGMPAYFGFFGSLLLIGGIAILMMRLKSPKSETATEELPA